MRKTLAGILIGMFVGGAIEAQIFSAYYTPGQLMETAKYRENDHMMEGIRLGYATGVADALSFVSEFGAKSTRSYEEDYVVMVRIDECLKFRGTTRGTLTSYAADVWRPLTGQKESAAALLAVSCLPKDK
jgi:hypothetical protein